ncbi:MAG: hypothetical protein ACYDBH_20710 [Acidobacteriaceae bacterium]
MLLSILLAVATVTQPTTWQGVTLGEPMSAVVSRLGDPMKVQKGTSVSSYYLYMANHQSTLLMLNVERGRVRGMRLFALSAGAFKLTDGHGIAFGATEQQLTTLNGKPNKVFSSTTHPVDVYVRADGTWSYEFVRGTVKAIQLDQPIPEFSTLPTVADPVVHGGTSFDDAIIDMADNEDDGVKSEYAYLQFHDCAPGVSWKTQMQSLLNHGKKVYDRLDTICPKSNEKRAFYFDITNYFGKM